jgi:hypothetical protein
MLRIDKVPPLPQADVWSQHHDIEKGFQGALIRINARKARPAG